jgi:hypothetical protein
MGRRTLLAIAILLFGLLLMLGACDSKPGKEGPTNPLDRENAGDPFELAVDFSDGEVTLSWAALDIPGLQAYTLFRKASADTAFVRVDTVGAETTEWTDPSPNYFATLRYRIAAVGADGAESDTTGRSSVTIRVPPYLMIAGGGASTAKRAVDLEVKASRVDSIRISEDSLFAGAPWGAFDADTVWLLSEGVGQKTLFLGVRRGEEDTTVSSSIQTAPTNGAVLLGGGDTTTARRNVAASISGEQIVRIILSTDSLLGDSGDDSLTFDTLTTLSDSIRTWTFDDGLGPKLLYAGFWNEFGLDTTVVDSILPDSLVDVSVLLAGGVDTVTTPTVSLAISAVATEMKLASSREGLAGTDWEELRADSTWTLGETVGTYYVYAQFRNDFVDSLINPAKDSVFLEPRVLAIGITAPEDSSFFVDGDSTSIEGTVIIPTGSDTPDSVTVFVDGLRSSAAIVDSTWTVPWKIDLSPADTLAVSVFAIVHDRSGTVADGITVFILPKE